MWHIYTIEYCAAARNDGIMQFIATWLKLETTTLNEGGQKKKDKMISLIYDIYNI